MLQALADNHISHDTPKVMDMAKYLIETHDQQQTFKAHAAALNPAAQLQAALTAGGPMYGTMDKTGKTFTPATPKGHCLDACFHPVC
ncbi:MAG: hypothetical protein WDN28_07730 [Chthoniobacter sp.]